MIGQSIVRMRSCVVVIYAVLGCCGVCLTSGDEMMTSSDLQEQLRVLSKQVTTLLDRRTEDLTIIEDNIRKKLLRHQPEELVDVRNDMHKLRYYH